MSKNVTLNDGEFAVELVKIKRKEQSRKCQISDKHLVIAPNCLGIIKTDSLFLIGTVVSKTKSAADS